MYEKYFKRVMDFSLSLLAIVILAPVLLVVAILIRIKLGKPVLFMQHRPGKDEKIFKLYKFRTMTDERDENGKLLPDDVRLIGFGKVLRSTSLDELPELFNILKGDMSIVGPRPLLVRDMVFMTEKQRMRHAAMPGLTGLAQVNGRNAIDWERKLEYDLEYIKKITFWTDVKIVLKTVEVAVLKREGITFDDMATAEDYGDYLLHHGRVSQNKYDDNQEVAKKILET